MQKTESRKRNGRNKSRTEREPKQRCPHILAVVLCLSTIFRDMRSFGSKSAIDTLRFVLKGVSRLKQH